MCSNNVDTAVTTSQLNKIILSVKIDKQMIDR